MQSCNYIIIALHNGHATYLRNASTEMARSMHHWIGDIAQTKQYDTIIYKYSLHILIYSSKLSRYKINWSEPVEICNMPTFKVTK